MLPKRAWELIKTKDVGKVFKKFKENVCYEIIKHGFQTVYIQTLLIPFPMKFFDIKKLLAYKCISLLDLYLLNVLFKYIVDLKQMIFPNFSASTLIPARSELWHSMFYIWEKKRVHYMWLPCDKATLSILEQEKAILAVRKSAGNVHQHNTSVTLRAEIGKPVPFLHFCSFFSTHSKLPPGS